MDILLWHKILSPYELAVNELVLKFSHMKKEHRERGVYCPIEHVSGRVKTISSILEKMQKKEIPMERMEELVEDIAGIRIICQFVEDIRKVAQLIEARSDIKILYEKDYVKKQKQSGYRSYHLIALYTVQTIDGPKELQVEIQIRTMAMDFWATVEHSLQYKYKTNIPEHIKARLSNAADAIISPVSYTHLDVYKRQDNIIAEAQAHAKELVAQTEIMQQAYAQANETVNTANQQAQGILDSAQQDANNIRMSAISYTDDMLANLSQIMGNALADVGERYSNFVGSLQSCYDIVNKNRSELSPQGSVDLPSEEPVDISDMSFDEDLDEEE